MFALSRGSGVPEATRAMLQKVQTLLNQTKDRGADMVITRQRIGIEGETRVCATFADTEVARETLERVRGMVKDTELMNVVIEPCSEK